MLRWVLQGAEGKGWVQPLLPCKPQTCPHPALPGAASRALPGSVSASTAPVPSAPSAVAGLVNRPSCVEMDQSAPTAQNEPRSRGRAVLGCGTEGGDTQREEAQEMEPTRTAAPLELRQQAPRCRDPCDAIRPQSSPGAEGDRNVLSSCGIAPAGHSSCLAPPGLGLITNCWGFGTEPQTWP